MIKNTKMLNELAQSAGEISNKQVLIGFDGFVKQDGEVQIMDGAGPKMAEGLLATGQKVKYIGALGEPVHAVFKEFAETTSAISICEPGYLKEITFEEILKKMGEGMFIDAIFRADLICFANWEMTPNMTSIMIHVIEKVLPNFGPREGRTFFFELGDVTQRSKGDLRAVLATIKRFQDFGDVLLAFDIKAAQFVYESFGQVINEITPGNCRKIASDLCQELKITMLAIHCRNYATCATHRDHFFVNNLLASEEADDNNSFNVGWVTGFLLSLSPLSCLSLAVAFSEFYLKNKKAPTLTEITSFISTTR